MFELYQLRCFVAVAEELHFGRAATRMNLTQPPLSRQVQMLETVVGVRLLHRDKRRVTLTPAGRVFLTDARLILEHARGAVNRARMAERGEAGALSVGFTALASVSIMPRLVAATRAEHPGIALILREMLSTDQERRLLAGQLDLALLRPPVRHRELTSILVHREPLVLAAPKSWALDGAGTIGLAALHGQPFVMYSPDEAQFFFDLLTSLFHRTKTAPDVVQHAGTPYSILSLVGIGLGAALVPASAQRFPAPDVRFLPVDLPEDATIDLLVAWRLLNDNAALPPVIATIRNLVQSGLLEPDPAPPAYAMVSSGRKAGRKG